MKQNAWFWILLFVALAAACAGFYLLRGGTGGVTAVVYVDGEVYDTYDLSAVVFPYEVTVETEYGYNTIRVGRGTIEVAEADCSEQVCVRQGAISDSLIPIVCLPHRLVIQIDDE